MIHTEGHPPPHVLAEVADGALDATSAARIEAHVRSCGACQGVLRELTQVGELLRSAPAELPMPEYVSAQISAVLATEAERADASRQEAPSAAVTALADRPVGWFRRPLPRVLAAAAAAAVIGFAGYGAFFSADAPLPVAGGAGGGDDASVDEDQPEVASDEDVGSAPEGAPNAGQESYQLNGREEDAPSAAGELALVPDILDIWHHPMEFAPDCGADLAAANGVELVGSRGIGAQILVVTRDGEELLGWMITECSALSEPEPEAVVDVPDE